MIEQLDSIIIGGGVIGLATARALLKSDPARTVAIFEKHEQVGTEISARNSEVIHGGIYYQPNSLKAKLCIQGKRMLYNYCKSHHIPHKKIGKLIVATNSQQVDQLVRLKKNAFESGVTDLEWKTKAELLEMEPALRAYKALYSPSTGIIDSHSYMQQLETDIINLEGQIFKGTEIIQLQPESSESNFRLKGISFGDPFEIMAEKVIVLAGLNTLEILKDIEGINRNCLPNGYLCKGSYFSYQGSSPFSHLIYPVPESHGLGIHGTLDLNNQLKFGPDTEYVDQIDYTVSDRIKHKFESVIKSYFPDLRSERLLPSYAGIRPKINSASESSRDFLFLGPEELKVNNLWTGLGLESPGLTASLAIGDYLADMVGD